MRTPQVLLVVSITAAYPPPIFAQTVATDSTHATSDILDSLQVGRQRWAHARVVEYRLQSHADCYCIYGRADFDRQLPLLTIRKGSVIAREKGKQGTPPSRELTIEDLFARIEEDARSDGRIIDHLDLDPVYGFPVRYRAHDPEIPDAWLHLQVDSFAVIRREGHASSLSNSPPPTTDAIIVSGSRLRLNVFLGRDFMPSTQPDTRLMAFIRLVPDSGTVPDGLSVENATFLQGSDKWNVVPKKEARWPRYFEVVARGGPKWPVGSPVDVIVQVKDVSGKSYLMHLSNVTITREE
jgi:hypothetical protein